MNYTDVLYDFSEGIATITINRADRLNCFRGRTIEELIHAFKRAWADKTAGVVILTGCRQQGILRRRRPEGDAARRAPTAPARTGCGRSTTCTW